MLMMNPENLKELIRKDRPDISDSSIKTYIQSIKRVSPNKQINNLDFLQDTDDVLEKVFLYPITTQRNVITSIIVGLKAVDRSNDSIKIYSDVLKKLTEKYQGQIAKNKKTDKEEANWVAHNELLTIAKTMVKNAPGSQRSLIAALYTFQSPVRLDYYDMEIVQKGADLKDDKNYLQIINRNKKTFIFNDYKSSSTYKTVGIPVNKALNTVLNKYLKLNPDIKYLLRNEKNKTSPMTRNSLGKTISKIFESTGKHITINLIRHIYISEHIDIEKTKEQNDLAKSMMHSGSTQLTYAKN